MTKKSFVQAVAEGLQAEAERDHREGAHPDLHRSKGNCKKCGQVQCPVCDGSWCRTCFP